MDPHSKRVQTEESVPPQVKRPRLGNLNVNPANDLPNQQLWSEARVHPESSGILTLTTGERELNADYPTLEIVFSSPDHADSGLRRVVIRNPATLEHLLNICYPVQVEVLSSLDRSDFRSMQLAGLGLGISRMMQRLHLIPVPCSNSEAVRPKDRNQVLHLKFLARIGWLPETSCDNTTATMDEIKPCTGTIWPTKFCPETTDDIDACREPHFDVTGNEVNGSSHNVCLDCIQLAARHMSFLEHRKLSRLRRTICSKHTRENTPQAQNEPCNCLVILDTEWRCWGCRRSALRGLTGIAMKRKNALDEGRYGDGEDDYNGDDGDNGNHGDDVDDGKDIKDGDNVDDGDYGEDGDDGDDGQDNSSDDDGERSDSNDSQDRDMRDDRIPRDGAHFCPIAGCKEWIKSQEQEAKESTGEGLKMCLACQTILLPSVEEEEDDDDDDVEC